MSDRQSAARDVVFKTLLFYIPVEVIFWMIIPLLIGHNGVNEFINMGIAGLIGGLILAFMNVQLTFKRFLNPDSDTKTILKEEIRKHQLYGVIRAFRTKSILLTTITSIVVFGPLPVYVLMILNPYTMLISALCMGAAGAISSWLNADYVTRKLIIPLAKELNLSNE
ncbi:MAG: hypothetical protein ACM3UZ_08660 [Acidobacteriota bacterium]